MDDSEEGCWTVQESIELAVPAAVITPSLQQRLRSRQDQPIGARLLAALRIVGFARRDYSNGKFRELMGEGVRELGELVGRKEEWAAIAVVSARRSRAGETV